MIGLSDYQERTSELNQFRLTLFCWICRIAPISMEVIMETIIQYSTLISGVIRRIRIYPGN